MSEAYFAQSPGIDRNALAAEIASRRVELEKRIRAEDIDALVVASEANSIYLTGYETTFWGNKSKPFVVVLAPPSRPVVVCHVGESVSVDLDAIDVDVEPYGGPEVTSVSTEVQLDYQLPCVDTVVSVLGRLGVERAGLELSWHFIPGLTPRALERLRDRFTGQLVDASAAIWSSRRVKSEWEIVQMRRAAAINDAAHREFAELARLGATERELGRLLRMCAYRAGAEKIGYSGIIAGIDRAPLGGPTDRRWERGQLLFVDLCLQVSGYFADFNRVYASASPTQAQCRAYADVVDALTVGRQLAKPTHTVAELASAMIGEAESPYARVGHGLGLEMPEPPSISPLDETRLLVGEVLCLEPNREISGVGWMVSEETVRISDGEPELLSPAFPEHLSVIDR